MFQLLLDYDEEYKLLGASGVFVEMWPRYASELRKFCNTKFKCEKHTEWAEDIENILLLMKALPLSSSSRVKQPFKDMIQKVIIYKVVRFSIEIK